MFAGDPGASEARPDRAEGRGSSVFSSQMWDFLHHSPAFHRLQQPPESQKHSSITSSPLLQDTFQSHEQFSSPVPRLHTCLVFLTLVHRLLSSPSRPSPHTKAPKRPKQTAERRQDAAFKWKESAKWRVLLEIVHFER